MGLNIRGEKVRQALNHLAMSPDLTISDLAKLLTISNPTARKVLEGLESLMVITRIAPHPKGVGKDRWLICDAAIAKYLGAARRTIEQVVLHQEILCQYTFAGLPAPSCYYYKTTRGSFVDFIIEDKLGQLAILLVDTVTPKAYELRALSSLVSKMPSILPWAIGPFSNLAKTKSNIAFIPWTHVL